MKDFTLSKSAFYSMLEERFSCVTEKLQSELNFCTTKGLVNLNPEFFEPGHFKLKTLKWKEWLALALASWFLKDECLQSYLQIELDKVYLGNYEFLKLGLRNKFHLINYLWESCLPTKLIFSLSNQISLNAMTKIQSYPPRRIQTKVVPVRRIGVGYKDQGSARSSHKKIFLPTDSRSIQYKLHVEKLARLKENLDLQDFIRGFGGLEGEFL